MEELNKIFERLNTKRNLIEEYTGKFQELNDSKLSEKELKKQSKILCKQFKKQMKSIDRN